MRFPESNRRPLPATGVVMPLALAAGAVLALAAGDAAAGPKVGREWKSAAKDLRNSVKNEAKADWFLARARAATLDEEEREEFLDEAKDEFREAKSLANDQYRARLDLAEALHEHGLYSVEIDPLDFVDGVTNPLMPLTPGVTRNYEAETEEGLETIVVTVLYESKQILGVNCTVVRDTVYLDGEIVEDTHDWFAQDAEGNVWYFGEIALNYEDGELADVDGSWKAGVDGAQPGIVMPAALAPGQTFRQEFYLGEAEDFGTILSLNSPASVPYGDFANCLQTMDGTPMEPEAVEHKYYAPGIGVVLEVDIESGERVELVSVEVTGGVD